MASLASVANTQTPGLTGRRIRHPYNLAMVSQTAAAQQVEAANLERKYRTDALNQQQTQFDLSLAQQRELADEQASQANKASITSGVTSLGSIAAMTKDAWLPAVKAALGYGAKAGAGAAAAGAGSAAGANAAAGLGAGTTSTATGLGTASAAEGSAAASAGSAAGAKASAGLSSGTASTSLGGLASTVGAAAGWAAAGRIATKVGGAWLEDISGGRNSNKLGARMGRTIQQSWRDPGRAWSDEWGWTRHNNETTHLGTIMDMHEPVGWAMDHLFGGHGSHLCTATDQAIGLDEREKLDVFRLRKYALVYHYGMMQFYLDEGVKLVAGIAGKEDPKEFYGKLKSTMLDPCLALVRQRKMEEAYQLYYGFTEQLFKTYAPAIEIPVLEHAESATL